ncbi:MAG: DUF429 domain-containing protein [Candidatus Lokiarchaeota archaeon]|nr:DUF429 domain-containing protein [Candidatus Lokiarchaeota archaeon]MBD3201818.1 DUF429 domain-containing protein [Candidatus Lokiarchaeota archaeon]
MEYSQFYIGIDSCPAGWISFYLSENLNYDLSVFKTINQLWEKYCNATLIMIDIPIGLKSQGPEPRLADKAARKYLTGKRSSCIFPTPCRDVLDAKTYEEANKINKLRTTKGLSKQSWFITSKIKEVDFLLRNNKDARNVFIECQPEICFTSLNNEHPLDHYKKTAKGIKKRHELLTNFYKFDNDPLQMGLNKFLRKNVGIDDILDAWVLAIAAFQGLDNIKFLPEKYPIDSNDLPMRIAIPQFKRYRKRER